MTITRRDCIQRVAGMLGGVALVGGDRLLAFSFDDGAFARAMAQGVGTFTAADVALLDEIAETILPETSTPGAKAARTGAFMALMVTDVYTDRNQQVFQDGMRSVDEACRRAHGTAFMQATPAERLAVVAALDREQQQVMDARVPAPSNRAPAPSAFAQENSSALRRSEPEPAHYFRMMKELALLGYFTSEIGCTKAMRYSESPGRFDPCAPHKPGDRSWAGHA
jgi:hypothetical protein